MESLRPANSQPRDPLHAELPIHRTPQPDRGLQSEHAVARVPAYGARSGVLQFWSASGPGISNRRLLGDPVRLRNGVLRADRHHDAVYNTAIPVCANRRSAVAGQYQSRIPACERTNCASERAESEFRSGARCFWRTARWRLRLFPAMEPGGSKDYWTESQFRDRVSRLEEYSSGTARIQPEPVACRRSRSWPG